MKKGYTLKGFNFGHNRDELNFSNYLIFNEKTPGPSKYQIQETQTRGKKSYSMRPKTAYPKNCKKCLIIQISYQMILKHYLKGVNLDLANIRLLILSDQLDIIIANQKMVAIQASLENKGLAI